MALPGVEMDEEYRESRAPAPVVFNYYNQYIKTNGLEKNMVHNTTVTMVEPIPPCPVSVMAKVVSEPLGD